METDLANQPCFESRSGTKHTSAFLVLLLVLAAVALPRFALLGGLPGTDEGVYAYFAQLMHASLASGKGLPDSGTLMFYPLLVNWVFSFDANPLIALRLIDMLVAVAAGYVLYRVLELESRSRLGAFLITFLFLFAMNQPMFIQNGFKNSMFASFLALFAALWLGLTAAPGNSSLRWVAIGILLSVAVMLRETFLPLAALGAVSMVPRHGLRSLLPMSVGAIGAGLLCAAVVIGARGGVATLLESYRDAAQLYATMADKRVELFIGNGWQALHECTVPLLVTAVGVALALVRNVGADKGAGLGSIGFWLAASLIPLIEPATKIGFPYHFSAALPGLAGLAALGWRSFCSDGPPARLYAGAAAMALALYMMVSPRFAPLAGNWQQTREVMERFATGNWPEAYTDKSNYLLAAQAIRQANRPNGTVAVSGYMYALYPLTGSLPPGPDLANLTNTIIKFDLSADRLREAMLRCPPDVVMTTSRTDWPGGPQILAAVRETGLYEQVAEIPTTSHRAYGIFGGLVFRAKKSLPCAA